MGVVAASLRRFRDARSDVRSVPRISSLPPEPDGPPRLLAIVPTEPIHQSLEAFLRTSGYYVQFAPSITDFWTSIAKAPPDLVLIPEGSAGTVGGGGLWRAADAALHTTPSTRCVNA